MALNAPTQGSGSIILKIAMTMFFYWIIDNGYFGKVELSALVHDEANVIYPQERKTKLPTQLKIQNDIEILGVRTLNVTKTNIIEKGIGQVLLEHQFTSAINKYWGNINFNLILYSTPPIP